jgi:hypothetical protein
MINSAKPAARKSKYGEGTTVRRIPNSMLHLVDEMLKSREVLEHKWNISMLPPVAQNLVEAITEMLIIPSLGFINVFQSQLDSLKLDDEATKDERLMLIKSIQNLRDDVKSMRLESRSMASELITRAITHDEY